MRAIVLLSGGMDSAVALFWAMRHYTPIDAITFNYGQVAQHEIECGCKVWECADELMPMGRHYIVDIPKELFASNASILGRSPINQYRSAAEAIENTPHDKSYLPLRNTLFLTLAAQHLLANSPRGGSVVVGIRGRTDSDIPGFPDCTHTFAESMTHALSEGAGCPITVQDPLNTLAPSRAKTIMLAASIPGCMKALAHTISCFAGERGGCGKCLPCIRRAQAFAEVGIEDPAKL